MASRPTLSRRPDFYSMSKSRIVLDYFRVNLFLFFLSMIVELKILFHFIQNERDFLHQLDPPVRNTQDYEGPLVSPIIQAAMKSAMKVEESLEFDAK